MIGKRGQGTTEYLIILAVVIVIALIVVGVMGWIPGLGTGITESQSKAYWQSTSPFAITTYQMTNGVEPVIVARNNTSQSLSITGMTINSVAYTTAADANFTGGQEISVTLTDNTVSCTVGNPYSYEVEINYTKSVGGTTVDLTQIGTKPMVGVCV